MEILNNDKIELICDDYKTNFKLSIYDTYGHYIDETVLSRDEVIELYNALEKLGL